MRFSSIQFVGLSVSSLSVIVLVGCVLVGSARAGDPCIQSSGNCVQAPVYSSAYSSAYSGNQGQVDLSSAAPIAVAGPSYISGYSSAAMTYVDPSSVAPISSNGAYQVQRPGYLDNPSVYTGVTPYVGTPVYSAIPSAGYQAAYPSVRAPLSGTLRGVATPMTYMQGMPSTYISSYDGSIPGQITTTTAPVAAPVTVVPAAPVTPLYPPAPPSRGCCLSRWCGKLFGTSYSTSYYRAPITYYRPVTTIDPVTSAPVVVQQPCNSYVQQIQRTPSTTLQFGPSNNAYASTPSGCPAPCANSACANSTCTNSTGYGQPVYSQGAEFSSGSLNSTVGQVGSVGETGSVTRIPSTDPTSISPPASGQFGSGGNTAPLIGVPTIAPPTGAGDLAPVGQPTLDADSSTGGAGVSSTPPQGQSSRQQWQLQNAEDSTALIRPTPPELRPLNQSGERSTPGQQAIIGNDNFTRAQPIEAPADYVAPYHRQSYHAPNATPVNRQSRSRVSQPDFYQNQSATGFTSVSARTPIGAAGLSSLERLPQGRAVDQMPRDATWEALGR